MPNDVYHGFHEFYVHCCQTGQSPAALLSGRQESARLPVDTAHDGDGEEAVFKLRLPLIAADIASFSRRDTRTFPMMEHLFSEGLARDLSEDTLLWIDSMGYSLDWLFFGQGAMLKNGYRPVPLFREGGAAPLDGREIRLMRSMAPSWTGSDWAWLHGGRYLRRQNMPPSLAIVSRAVVSWNILPLSPALPDAAEVCAHVQDVAKTLNPQSWGRTWRSYVVRRLQASQARAGMLVGLTPSATASYMAGRSEPTDSALKAFLLLDGVLTRHGRDGLVDFLNMLNEEAISRGFADLGEVFRKRTWGWTSRSDSTEKSHDTGDRA